jgi:hypothetical protein
MAPRAPKPGSTRKGGDSGRVLRFKIVLDGDELLLDMRDVGAMDEQMFEAQTKTTFADVLQKLDSPPNLAALVWLARRKRGEKRLTYRDVLKGFPSRMDLADMHEAGTFDLDVLTEEDLVEEEVEGTDPLPSADD